MNRPSFIEPIPVMQGIYDLLKKDEENRLADEWYSISFWEWRTRSLESWRHRLVRKAAWSAKDCMEIDEINDDLKEAYDMINKLQNA
jgi:hypothetical protein